MPTDYGPIATLADTILYRVDTPASAFASSLAPVQVVAAVPFRESLTLPDQWQNSTVIPVSEFTTTPRSVYTRIVPKWALDYRSYFPNTYPYSVATVFNMGYPISSNNSAGLFPEGNYYQWPVTGIPVTGQMTGQTQEEGVRVPGRTVALYYRPTMQLISQQKSDADGYFTFTGLEPGVPDYLIVGVNIKPLVYDAVVHDTVAPIFVSDIPASIPNYTDPSAVLPGFVETAAVNTQTITVDFGEPSFGADSFQYAFYRDGAVLLRSGITTNRYQPYTTGRADANSTITCRFTARNGAGFSTLTYVDGIYVA